MSVGCTGTVTTVGHFRACSQSISTLKEFFFFFFEGLYFQENIYIKN